MVHPELIYRQAMRVLALIAAAALLTACVSDTTTGGANTARSTTQEEQKPSPDQSREASPQPEESSTPEPDETVPCEDVMFQRAQGTIRSQQSAFANGDFEAARAFASGSFRDSVPVDQFEAIIEGTYAFLLTDPAFDFLDCQRLDETALIQVEVSGSPVTVMAYRMVLENESWFIDAASVVGTRNDVTA